MSLNIRKAEAKDCPLILEFIKGLAEYEKLAHEVVATPELLKETLFGAQPKAEVLIAEWNKQPAGFALFFHNYSTFLGRPGIYLEDLFVLPTLRSHGVGKGLLKQLAQIAVERNCGRLEWSVLDWNKPAIDFYLSIGAGPMDEWTMYRLTGEKLKNFAANK
ncbi:N-acetyltransferase family protein [Bdellovibrio sp. HCB337]|uniref:GNAT family N-acetyltransferase n=1 Tax=Bdellovibrio sp. HCB337 TaxID=3394358 RepID=UPI0039A4EA56